MSNPWNPYPGSGSSGGSGGVFPAPYLATANELAEYRASLQAQAQAQLNLGIGSLGVQNAAAVNVDGGTIDGVNAGVTTPLPRMNALGISAVGPSNHIPQFTNLNTPFMAETFIQGSPTPSIYGATSPFQFTISDVTTYSYAAGTNGLNGVQIRHAIGTGASGIKQALVAQLICSGTPVPIGDDPTLYGAYVAGQFQCNMSVTFGGIGGPFSPDSFTDGYRGAGFGSNPQIICQPGGIYLRSIVAEECNVEILAGTPAPATEYGIAITHSGSHAVRGTYDSAAISINDQVGVTATWKTGLTFGTYGQKWPFGTDSALITAITRQAGGSSPCVADIGVDFTQVAFTTAAIKTPGFSVDPDGDLTAKSFHVTTGAAAPTTAQIPTGAFLMWKNTTDGTLKLYANDGGTLKSLTLT